MKQMFQSLEIGLAVAVVVILIMLTAYFQAPRLAITAVASVPGVLSGVVLALWVTRTTLNIESFMGAIMAVGVAVSNAIMLVSSPTATVSRRGCRPIAGDHRGQGTASADHHDRLRHDLGHDPDVTRPRERERADPAGPAR